MVFFKMEGFCQAKVHQQAGEAGDYIASKKDSMPS